MKELKEMTEDEILDAMGEDVKEATKITDALKKELNEGTLSSRECRKRLKGGNVYDERIRESLKELKQRSKERLSLLKR